MKIALIIERIETWRGGAETSTMGFAEHLARLGCDVHVLTTTDMPSTPALTIVHVPTPRTFRSLRTRRFVERAQDYARAHDFDVVHGITPCPAADVYQPRGGTVPEMIQRNADIRGSAIQRGLKRIALTLSPKIRVQAALERKLLRRPDPPYVIAISDYVARQLDRHYGFNGERVRRIFNGVDADDTAAHDRAVHRHEVRRQFKIAADDYLLLCVAHNFKLKGVRQLIEAVAIVQSEKVGKWESGKGSLDGPPSFSHLSTFPPSHSNVRVLIVGRDDPAPYAALAARLAVSDRIVFAGSTQRIQRFFHAADVLVHPTFYDPCSRVVLEALASGLPVVTTRLNGAAECVTDAREGYVIDTPKDVTALADRIRRLADPGHRAACARSAPDAVRHCTMADHAAQVLALYQEIASPPRSPNPQSEIRDAESETRNPQSAIRNPQSPGSEISDLQSEISNPRSEISNPRSEISNLKSEIPTPRPNPTSPPPLASVSLHPAVPPSRRLSVSPSPPHPLSPSLPLPLFSSSPDAGMTGGVTARRGRDDA